MAQYRTGQMPRLHDKYRALHRYYFRNRICAMTHRWGGKSPSLTSPLSMVGVSGVDFMARAASSFDLS